MPADKGGSVIFRRSLLLFTLPTLLFAQASPLLSAPGAGERMEVRIIEIDAVVTDRNGKIVQGLKREDFELRENYRSQPISNFQEIRLPQPNDVVAASSIDGGGEEVTAR